MIVFAANILLISLLTRASTGLLLVFKYKNDDNFN